MAEADYIYTDRIVAFIDVLGFQEKLYEFEKDAQAKKIEEGTEYLVSEKVNEFINTFKNVTELLDKDNFQYYLFSDNICITVDYVAKPDAIVSLLFTISELFYSFAQKGYFLRGGMEIGKFIDEKQIALGVPLAKAYMMESKDAVNPRILISDEYYKLIQGAISQNRPTGFEILSEDFLINHNCEMHYLNVFCNILKKEDKVAFFSDIRVRIIESLQQSSRKEKINTKYTWLAEEYNQFLEFYISDFAYRDDESEPTEEFIEILKTLKILNHGF
jgi:hypothetical protein